MLIGLAFGSIWIASAQAATQIPVEDMNKLYANFAQALAAPKSLPGNCALQEAASDGVSVRFSVVQDRSANFEIVPLANEYFRVDSQVGIRTHIQRIVDTDGMGRETVDLVENSAGVMIQLKAVRERFEPGKKEWQTRDYIFCEGSLEPIQEVPQPAQVPQPDFEEIRQVLAPGLCSLSEPEFRKTPFGDTYLAVMLELLKPTRPVSVSIFGPSAKYQKVEIGDGRREIVLEQFQPRKTAQAGGRIEHYAYDWLKLTLRYSAASLQLESASLDLSYAGIPGSHSYVSQVAGTCESTPSGK